MKYYNLEYLPLNNPYMKKIIRAVKNALPEMKAGKKYTLRKMVELSDEDAWCTNSKQLNKRAGKTFKDFVLENIPNLVCVSEDGEYPLKYIKIR